METIFSELVTQRAALLLISSVTSAKNMAPGITACGQCFVRILPAGDDLMKLLLPVVADEMSILFRPVIFLEDLTTLTQRAIRGASQGQDSITEVALME